MPDSVEAFAAIKQLNFITWNATWGVKCLQNIERVNDLAIDFPIVATTKECRKEKATFRSFEPKSSACCKNNLSPLRSYAEMREPRFLIVVSNRDTAFFTPLKFKPLIVSRASQNSSILPK